MLRVLILSVSLLKQFRGLVVLLRHEARPVAFLPLPGFPLVGRGEEDAIGPSDIVRAEGTFDPLNPIRLLILRNKV